MSHLQVSYQTHHLIIWIIHNTMYANTHNNAIPKDMFSNLLLILCPNPKRIPPFNSITANVSHNHKNRSSEDFVKK